VRRLEQQLKMVGHDPTASDHKAARIQSSADVATFAAAGQQATAAIIHQ